MSSLVFNDLPMWATKRRYSVGLLAAIAPLCIAASIWSRRKIKRLPPSPPQKYWFGGHGYLIPRLDDKELFWQVFTRLAREYGDVMYLSIDGEDNIILSSYEAINDLFATRGALYSDRQIEPWITDIMGWGKLTSFRDHDEDWRKSRRLTNIGLSAQGAESYHAVQAKNVHRFLQCVVSDPDEWPRDLNWMFAAIIMRVVYGYPVKDPADPLVDVVNQSLRSLQSLRYTPSWVLAIIKRFPIVCSFPTWLPGMNWKRQLLKERHWPEVLVGHPWKWAADRIAAGDAVPSFVSQLLEMNDDGPEGEDLIKWVSGTLFSGGAHTSFATICNFILAMVLHPEVAKKAQAEIDHVVGPDRLPEMADQERLRYVECVILEVMRWKSVAPLAVPHRVAVEDEYKGYRIPANSIVVSNLDAVLHDEKMFPEPYSFKPERFLNESDRESEARKPIINPRDVVFGIGRRSCPGFRVANAAVFLTISNMLATMDFGRAEGDEGNLDVGCTSGFVATPLPFKCSIKPRSEVAVKLINEIVLSEQE